MSEIPKKNEENGRHLPYGAMDEQAGGEEEMRCSGSERKKVWLLMCQAI
jgi:hypothetical protein